MILRPMRIGTAWLWDMRIPFPPPGSWPLLLTLIICNQPLGSSFTLVLFFLFTMGLALLRRIPARVAGNSACILVLYFLILLTNSLFIKESINLFLFYSFYAAMCVAYFIIIKGVVERMSTEDVDKSILLILLLDMLLNVPAVAMQIGLHGVGDYVSGLSGLFSQGSLSQGRTNTVRAGMLMVLALVRYSRKKDGLSLVSAGFNMAVLVGALSMTAILSAFGAGMVALFAAKQRHRMLKLALIVGIVVLGGIFNEMKYGVSYANYLLALNYHYELTPKFNIYKVVIEQFVPDRPWTFLFGNGLGNLMNRFAILFNFENYSAFPFKEHVQSIFESTEARTHMINRYYLESGVVGNSIVSVPWSSGLAIFLEAGVLGLGLLFFSVRHFIRDVLKVRRGLIASGTFFLAFFFFNIMFDVYVDYPEVLCAFLMVGFLLGAMERPQASAEDVGGVLGRR